MALREALVGSPGASAATATGGGHNRGRALGWGGWDCAAVEEVGCKAGPSLGLGGPAAGLAGLARRVLSSRMNLLTRGGGGAGMRVVAKRFLLHHKCQGRNGICRILSKKNQYVEILLKTSTVVAVGRSGAREP